MQQPHMTQVEVLVYSRNKFDSQERVYSAKEMYQPYLKNGLLFKKCTLVCVFIVNIISQYWTFSMVSLDHNLTQSVKSLHNYGLQAATHCSRERRRGMPPICLMSSLQSGSPHSWTRHQTTCQSRLTLSLWSWLDTAHKHMKSERLTLFKKC